MDLLRSQNFNTPFTRDSVADLTSAITAAVPGGAATTSSAPPTAPSLPVALLFPGQGSQAVGMISAATAGAPAVAAMLQHAERELGYDVLELITKGEQLW